MKTHGGIEIELHAFLTSAHYPRGQSSWYQFDTKLGGLQSQSGSGCEQRKNLLPLPGI